MNRSRLVLLAVIVVAGSAAVYTATITSLSALPPDKAPLDRFVLTQFQPTGDERDIKAPILLTQVNPEYTEEGRRRRIEGIVELEVAISHMGQVTSATVKKSLDTVFGLDDAAVAAAKRWYFVPRTVNGRAVASTAVVQMEFRLPDAPEPVHDTQQQSDPEVIAPVAIKRVEPKYTPEAMRAKIQGKVRIEAVVNTNGDVVNARILESLDAELGLDASALTAASQWKYEPGRYKGKAVASKVVIDMEFRLH